MAAGGYMSSSLCVTKLGQLLLSRERAKEIISDALVSGGLRSRAWPKRIRETAVERLARGGSPKKRSETKPLGPVQIGVGAWISLGNWRTWPINWETSSIALPGKFEGIDHEKLQFYENDFNAIVSLTQAATQPAHSAPPSDPKPRTRKAYWNDWVAAIATIAHEHKIHKDMSQTELRAAIEFKLDSWGLRTSLAKTLSERTVAAALDEILRRYTFNAPVCPAATGPTPISEHRQKP